MRSRVLPVALASTVAALHHFGTVKPGKYSRRNWNALALLRRDRREIWSFYVKTIGGQSKFWRGLRRLLPFRTRVSLSRMPLRFGEWLAPRLVPEMEQPSEDPRQHSAPGA